MLPPDMFSEDDPATIAILSPESPRTPVSSLKWISQYHRAYSVSHTALEEFDRKGIS
jgi:hypothetical protein